MNFDGLANYSFDSVCIIFEMLANDMSFAKPRGHVVGFSYNLCE